MSQVSLTWLLSKHWRRPRPSTIFNRESISSLDHTSTLWHSVPTNHQTKATISNSTITWMSTWFDIHLKITALEKFQTGTRSGPFRGRVQILRASSISHYPAIRKLIISQKVLKWLAKIACIATWRDFERHMVSSSKLSTNLAVNFSYLLITYRRATF